MKDDIAEKRNAETGKGGIQSQLSALTIAALLCPGALIAAEGANEGSTRQSGWAPFAAGGYVHQFDSDLDAGGSFEVDRYFLQAGMSYSLGPRRRVSFSVGGGSTRYDFSGGIGLADDPWGSIDQLRFSVPVTWAIDEQWTLFAIPTLRYYGESGVGSGDAATGGALAGVSYRVNDSLTIGPGIGVLSRLEDSANVIPILLIEWQITDRLNLGTGRGLAATQGPGLELNYRLSETWSFGLGGRYESLQFRLDDKGPAPNGVGEDRSIPLYLSATYARGRDLRISAIAGMEINGELRLEDASGRQLAREDYGSTPFLGATFDIRF
ncbi:autotransporter outer membrane beta-barrel domain-containing protein [Thiorhodococcus mannitoliphagus]|uniref:Autotransporter outer membrane beta-barrel domain-containing protein n=1 Tax=Thiorhodococcus mannitoliphagus TaxID=329406 RepID=A0A6P1DUY1_9GAMM|nr:autotransporter outer membrane beta-barrel domain-containing protein [Thiorhodococcus mannitoliphagus]NEX21003.1 autotransporter outer membrane beta-barrel domain-containing protein [Thiorhodococcus mannitoliphagus]